MRGQHHLDGLRDPSFTLSGRLPPEGEHGTSGHVADVATSMLVIACGALARELKAVLRASRFGHVAVTCLPAILHNRPARIPAAVRAKIEANRHRYSRILCLYGDCGTGGELDRVLAEYDVPRISGAHCYAFFAGLPQFDALAEAEPGTFYLTDYLARHFDRLVIEGLGIDRHPELLSVYFGNYTKLLYFAQTLNAELVAAAERAAGRLGLRFETRITGVGGLESFLDGHAVAAHEAA